MTRRKNDTPAPAIPTNLPPIPVAGNGEPSPVGPPEAVSPPGRRTLNGRFLACLLIAALLLGAGVHLLHAYQVRRNASALLTHANQAEEDGDLDRAIQYLEHYLGLVQEDNDALARYGRALYKRGGSADEKQRAFLVLEQVVRRKPDRRDVRRDLVDVAMDLEDYPAALQHLDELLKASPSDAELERVAAACETAAGRLDRAEGWLQQAIRHAPDQVAGYVQLAALYRNRLQQPDKADEIMAKLVQANERSFQAHLARWHYQKELGRAEAEADLARAQELAPDAADVILAAAESAEARGEVALVRAGLERGIGLYPQDYRMYQALAALEIRAGQYREAAAIAERGLKAVPGQVEELLPTLAEALIEQGELARAREQLDQLRKLKISEARRDYLEARVLVHQKEWAAAAALLERIRLRLNARSSLVVPVNLSLAYCYGQLGNPDQQLAACRRAVAANPQAVAPRQALAAALLTVGRLDEAAEEYRRLSAQVPGALVALAGVQLVQTLSLPPAKRRWEPVNRTLDAAAQAVSDSTEVALLRSEALAAQGQPEAARQVLEAARDRRPGDVEVWAALADLLQRQGELDQALAVLEQARQQLGDTADLRLARARLWASSRCQPAGSHRPLTEARPALEELTRGLERFAGADRLRLLDGLAEAYARVGDLAEARRLWGQLAEQRPTDLITRFRLFDLALRADDTADARRLAAEVRRLEGENGALAPYCEAALLVQTARHWASSRLTPAGSQRPLAEARRLLALAAERRPSWPRPLLLLADVALLENNVDAAIDHYKQARNLGAGSPELTRRLVDLLYARQRYAEAEEILSQMQNDAPLPAGLSKVAAAIALRREDSGRALELARQAVAGSKDFRDYLWLGRMLWSAGQRDQAEAALRHALRLADNVPDTWVALATYLARADRPAEAEALIEQARRKLPPDLAPLALAQCYLALGRPDRAEEQYRAAVEARPDDVLVRRTVALFYLDRDQLEQAKPHLRFLFAPTTKAPLGDAAWARRTLALALASGGDYAQSFEALTLVELNLQQLGNRPEDLRAKAIVLASRPSRRAEAIELFEEVSRRQPLAPGDQFLLAQLYEAADNWRAAKARMEAAVNSPGGDTPRYLAAYVRALLRHGEVEAARPLCDRLEKLEPKGLRAAEMRARLLHAQGRTAEAVALLQKFAQNADAPQAGLVAALLEELGQPALAEDLYRRFVAASPQPEAVLVLIEYLGRQQRVREALELCERAWQTCPPEAVAAASVIVLRAGEADPELYRPVERRLEAAIEKDPRSVGLLFILANFRDLQGRYDEVKALYRQVLHYDSRHVLALNNLAWLLAVTEGKGDEALALLERAIAIAGPGSNLLDTRGCVRLAMGRAGLAVKDLQEAAAITPTAVTYFHLAQAYQAVKNPGEAAAAFRKAQALGLDAKQLHPLERPAYLRLLAELGSK